MRFHFQASTKPILKSCIFSIVSEPFFPVKGQKQKSGCSHSILVEIGPFLGEYLANFEKLHIFYRFGPILEGKKAKN